MWVLMMQKSYAVEMYNMIPRKNLKLQVSFPSQRVKGLRVPNDLQRYVSWSLVLLVGPPMPNRSKGRNQTTCDPLVLQVGDWAGG